MGSRLLVLAACLCTCLPMLAQQDTQSTSADHPSETTNNGNSAPSDSQTPPPLPRPDLTPDAKGNLSAEQMQALTRIVARNYRDNAEKKRDYTYVERDVDRTFDGGGRTKSTEIKTYEVTIIYDEQVWRMVAKDDKPLDAKEAAKEEGKIQKIMDKHKGESEEEQKKQEEQKDAKRREDGRKFVAAIVESHDFKLAGDELLDGRDTWVIDAEPRHNFDSEDKQAKFVSKFRGRLWIDKQDLQLAKVEVEAIDTAAVGWVLARIHKGTRMTYEQMRMDDDIWLPKHLTYKFDARVALFKGYNMDGEQTYRDYKKFRTSARIVSVGTAEDAK
jgi:hypothetical protein